MGKKKKSVVPRSALQKPKTDPTPIFELFRGSYATELLAAAGQLGIFEKLAGGPVPASRVQKAIGLAARPFAVLATALRAMGILSMASGKLQLTPLAHEHLLPGGPFFVGDYIGLAAGSPGVQALVERLRSNKPAGGKEPDQGAAFIFRKGIESAMEKEASARGLTLALAGRAKNVAPFLADAIDLRSVETLLDIGGGTGIYSIACLQKNPQLRAVVWDRPEVLKVAAEFAAEFGVADRLQLVPGDMFTDPFPCDCDAILLSNILHDWDVPECRKLISRSAATLPTGGRLFIHDVFLDDDLGGPLPIALYSAALFSLTEGRAYSAAEYRDWLHAAGMSADSPVPTLIHCGVLTGTKKRARTKNHNLRR